MIDCALKVYKSIIVPLSMLLSMDSGSCILWIWMQPETCPVPGKVSLPVHPRLVLVTKRLRACSLSGSPISLSTSIILKPNTSPHLHLDFIEKFSCLKFKTVEIFIIITESIVIQSSTNATYRWIRNTQQHAPGHKYKYRLCTLYLKITV